MGHDCITVTLGGRKGVVVAGGVNRSTLAPTPDFIKVFSLPPSPAPSPAQGRQLYPEECGVLGFRHREVAPAAQPQEGQEGPQHLCGQGETHGLLLLLLLLLLLRLLLLLLLLHFLLLLLLLLHFLLLSCSCHSGVGRRDHGGN